MENVSWSLEHVLDKIDSFCKKIDSDIHVFYDIPEIDDYNKYAFPLSLAYVYKKRFGSENETTGIFYIECFIDKFCSTIEGSEICNAWLDYGDKRHAPDYWKNSESGLQADLNDIPSTVLKRYYHEIIEYILNRYTQDSRFDNSNQYSAIINALLDSHTSGGNCLLRSNNHFDLDVFRNNDCFVFDRDSFSTTIQIVLNSGIQEKNNNSYLICQDDWITDHYEFSGLTTTSLSLQRLFLKPFLSLYRQKGLSTPYMHAFLQESGLSEEPLLSEEELADLKKNGLLSEKEWEQGISLLKNWVDLDLLSKNNFQETLSDLKTLDLIIDEQADEQLIQEALNWLNPANGQYVAVVDKSFLTCKSALVKKIVDDNLLDTVVQAQDFAVLFLKYGKKTNIVRFYSPEKFPLPETIDNDCFVKTTIREICSASYSLPFEDCCANVFRSEEEVLSVVDKFLAGYNSLCAATYHAEEDMVYEDILVHLLCYAKKHNFLKSIIEYTEDISNDFAWDNLCSKIKDNYFKRYMEEALSENIDLIYKCVMIFGRIGDISSTLKILDQIDKISFNKHYLAIVRHCVENVYDGSDFRIHYRDRLLISPSGNYSDKKMLIIKTGSDCGDVYKYLPIASELKSLCFCCEKDIYQCVIPTYLALDDLYGEDAEDHLFFFEDNWDDRPEKLHFDIVHANDYHNPSLTKEDSPFFNFINPAEWFFNNPSITTDLFISNCVVQKFFQKYDIAHNLEQVVVFNKDNLCFINCAMKNDNFKLVNASYIDNCTAEEILNKLIDEIISGKEGRHVRDVSYSEFAQKGFSLDVNRYFSKPTGFDMEEVWHKIIERLDSAYRGTDDKNSFFAKHILGILYRICDLNHNEHYLHYDIKYDGTVVSNSTSGLEEFLIADDCSQIVESLLDYCDKNNLCGSALPIQNRELTELVTKLCTIDGNQKRLFNPFAGAEAYTLPFEDISYFGSEQNPLLLSYIETRFAAKGICYSNFKSTNVLENDIQDDKLFDIILSTPPFDGKLGKDCCDYLFNRCIDKLNDKGEMIVVLPANFLYSTIPFWVSIRSNLVEKRLLESVIILPEGLFKKTGSLKTCIVKLSKKKNSSITFVNATTFCDRHPYSTPTLHVDDILKVLKEKDDSYCMVIPAKQIEKHEYRLLNPELYKMVTVPEGYTAYKLADVLSMPDIAVNFEEKSGKVFLRENLSSDYTDYLKHTCELDEMDLNVRFHKITGNALILSKMLNPLKATYCYSPDNEPFFINEDTMIAFALNEDVVRPDYICYALQQPEVLRQISLYDSSNQPSLNRKLISDVVVFLPSLEEQKQVVNSFYKERALELKKEVQNIYQTIDNEREEEFKSLKHAFGKPAAGIQAAIDTLIEFFEDKGIMDLVISDRRLTTVRDKLKYIKDCANFMNVLMINGANFLDTSKYPLKSITVRELWHQVDFESDKFATSYSDDIDKDLLGRTLRVNPDLFKILLNDIRSNVEKHAFPNNSIRNEVTVEVNSDGSNFILLIYNNGVPFPEDVDTAKFTKRHWSFGETRGSGIGGNEIQKIMRHFGGDFELATDYTPEYPTCYILKFPVE